MVRKKKKIKLDLPKTTEQVNTLGDYLILEMRNSIIDIVNKRSDLRKCLLAASDYGKNIQENINAVVADGKFNQAVVRRALDEKDKGVFESPIPLSVTFKDQKEIHIQNPIIGNLLSQVNANKISDAKVKQLLGQAKDEELQARLDRLRKRIDKSDDEDNNNNNNNNINFDDSNMMIIMLVEKNYVENKVILDDR